MFERYTEQARRAIFFARYEASQLNNQEIDDAHIALGVLRAAPYLIRRIAPNASVEQIRQQLSETAFDPKGERRSTSIDLPLTERSQQILFLAAQESEKLAGRNINVAHLLLALTLHPNSPSVDILTRHGITADKLREQLARFEEEDKVEHDRVKRSVQPKRTPASRARVGEADGCMEIVWGSVRVGIAALAATTHIPRKGEELVIQDADLGLRSFVVADVTYYFENIPPVVGAPHRLSKVVVRVDKPADPVAGALYDST